MSSLLRLKQYFPLNMLVKLSASHWKSCGSERKTKSGENSSVKCERFNAFLRQPSIFQEITWNMVASAWAELSPKSLNQSEEVLWNYRRFLSEPSHASCVSDFFRLLAWWTWVRLQSKQARQHDSEAGDGGLERQGSGGEVGEVEGSNPCWSNIYYAFKRLT